MITFPFWCPACLQDVDATADPVELLFGGGELTVTCNTCSTVFRADVAEPDEPITAKEAISASD